MIKKITSIILNKLIINSKHRILIPFYHAVSDTAPTYIKHLYSPRSISNFENDLDVLMEFYKPISLKKMSELIETQNPIKENYFHLTFDDGLANFYEIVAPILLKRKIPATVFINTDFVDNNDLFYRFKASLLLDNYLNSENDDKLIFHHFFKQNEFSNSDISKCLLEIEYSNMHLLDELANKLNYNFSDFLENEKPYLLKNQITKLIEQGFTFGAHSTNHPLYYKLSQEDQLEQTLNSLNWVDKELNQHIKAFSFPFTDFGVSIDFFNRLDDSILDVSFGTSGLKRDMVKNNLQRVSFENFGKNTKLFLIKEYLKYFIKIPLGKSVMKR
ncbi:polysaccharide deacetylase family protein [Lutibacter sp. A80]|uniref:polysaccharide deacetylase family protein n=1 Tax=Lutibacter sp. A80 TaxID=2918453 RepID=UPI001F05CBFA|nr:polysaccharide deacetylase family protein [Lutibacter sp. A80]UMB61939.1 polysaccharide deacetylase family protein [Lutibacter sp. A80]